MDNMNKEQRSKFWGILLIIWFIASFIAMFYFKDDNIYYTVMLCGQYFLVFGLIASSKKTLLGLPFVLIGLGCIAVPFFMLNSHLLSIKINPDNLILLLLASVFGIIGICLIIASLHQRKKSKETTKVIVPAKIVDYNVSSNGSKKMYTPICEYNFNGIEYTICDSRYNDIETKELGTVINIEINPNSPASSGFDDVLITSFKALGTFFLIMALFMFGILIAIS